MPSSSALSALSALPAFQKRAVSAKLLSPLHEAFEREKLRQPEVVVHLRRVPIAVLGTLPELAPIRAAGEHGAILLRLMAENRGLLAFQIARAQRHDTLDLVRLPF